MSSEGGIGVEGGRMTSSTGDGTGGARVTFFHPSHWLLSSLAFYLPSSSEPPLPHHPKLTRIGHAGLKRAPQYPFFEEELSLRVGDHIP